jgi:hypothetical protein
VTTAFGTGRQGFDGDGHFPLQSWLNQPTELAFDDSDQPYLVDWNNHRIRTQGPDGSLATVVGAPLPGDWPLDLALDQSLPGRELHINHPMDLAFTGDALVLAAWHNHKLLRLERDEQMVSVMAGGNRPGYAGDGGPAAAALLNFPDSLVVQPDGAVLISDERNNLIRRITADDEPAISTVIGVKGPAGFAGDEEAANSARLALSPYDEAGGSDNPPPGGALALADDGTLFLADTCNHCVRRITPGADGLVGVGDPSEERIETVAGECGSPGYDPSANSGVALRLRLPTDLELHDGALYIADTGNHVVWRIELESGDAIRVVGTGTAGETPDGSQPLDTLLDHPYGIAFDHTGNLFIADTMNNRIRVLWK